MHNVAMAELFRAQAQRIKAGHWRSGVKIAGHDEAKAKRSKVVRRRGKEKPGMGEDKPRTANGKAEH